MVIPKRKEDYENKSVEELVKEQQEIMKQIINFENILRLCKYYQIKEDNSEKS